MYYTYILYSGTLNEYYTGHSQDLSRRLEEHNRGKSQSSAKGLPWTLVFSSEFHSRSEAVRLEIQIKKRGAKRYLLDLKGRDC